MFPIKTKIEIIDRTTIKNATTNNDRTGTGMTIANTGNRNNHPNLDSHQRFKEYESAYVNTKTLLMSYQGYKVFQYT
ncbi:hypothetical protein BLOT_014609 [Blomia tropicalis]|nr:hypothetical protein BLOT_014609 [Blomia tropicalis]